MTTVRQIGGLWQEGQTGKLMAQLAQYRGDLPDWLAADLAGNPTAVAAVALIRLAELDQTHTPAAANLTRKLLADQLPDGGFGDTLVTALAVRALRLLIAPAAKSAAGRGLAHLTALQQDDGSFPREPLRRMPACPTTTAFVLVQLGADPVAAAQLRVEAALSTLNHRKTDARQSQLAKLALLRTRSAIAGQARGLAELALAS